MLSINDSEEKQALEQEKMRIRNVLLTLTRDRGGPERAFAKKALQILTVTADVDELKLLLVELSERISVIFKEHFVEEFRERLEERDPKLQVEFAINGVVMEVEEIEKIEEDNEGTSGRQLYRVHLTVEEEDLEEGEPEEDPVTLSPSKPPKPQKKRGGKKKTSKKNKNKRK